MSSEAIRKLAQAYREDETVPKEHRAKVVQRLMRIVQELRRRGR
jgi:hypothetical protein